IGQTGICAVFGRHALPPYPFTPILFENVKTSVAPIVSGPVIAGVASSDFGILTWSTSAVCFGPPWAQQTSTLDLSVSLDSEAGVGLESQGGTIRADSVGV